MSKKIIGVLLLVGAVFIASLISKSIPSSSLSQPRPSENVVSPTNTNVSLNLGSPAPVISQPQSQATPLKNRVAITSANVFSYPQEYSRITLSSRLQQGETVNITGWKLKSNRGEIIIPQAIEVYEPGGFSASNNIILKPNNSVDLYSLTSPLNRNLRLNKCIGYLQKTYNFLPIYLPQNCPYISRDDVRQYSGECQNYVMSLGTCQYPDDGFYNTLPGTNEGNDCRSFLQTIGYGSCFRSHQQDSDFLSNNWIVWLNNSQILNSQHDYLRLYNEQGELVSEYNY